MKTFKINQTVKTRSIGDHNCIFEGTILARTAKTVTVKVGKFGIFKRKVHTREGNEFIFPLGQYSMAPTFRA